MKITLLRNTFTLLICLLFCWQASLAQTMCTDPMVSYQYDNGSTIDECCWFISINNNAVSNQITAVGLDNFIDCEIGALTAFGGWTIASQSNTDAIITPNTPFIQPGNYPQQFKICLSNRTDIPQFFDVIFLETDPTGNYIEFCTTQIAIDCPINSDPICATSACFNPNYQGGTTYNFDASCSTGTGSLSYAWDFGDGNTSTVMNPSHTYTSNQPVYNVCLTTTNTMSNGAMCMDTVCIMVDSPTMPDTCIQSCDGSILELVVNGDFSLGDNSFNSSLQSMCTCQFGTYCITTDATLKCANTMWCPIMEPGTGGGNYMVIDGALGSVWSQTVNVISGETYTFSFDYFPNISADANLPILSLNVDGNVVMTNIMGIDKTWRTYCVDWTASASGSILLDIQQIGGLGFNDYGIDNISFSTCCDLDVSLPDTMTVCENELVQLNPIVSGAVGAVTYSWSPSTGLSNTAIANPTTTATTLITYTVVVTDSLGCTATNSVVINPVICPCDDQVVNGDFESGDTGFTSGLTSSCTCQAGSYCVTTDAKLKCNSGLWQNILAPNGAGNYMVIDGSANSDIWTQSVTVVAGYVYEFCFDYYPDISNGSTPPLSVDLDPTGNAWNILPPTTGTAGSWQKICTTWKAPSSGTFDLNISQGAAGNYDDYGIDNIQFGTCCELEVNLQDTITVCENDLVQLNPIVSGAMGAVTYSWSPSTGLSDPSIANPTTTATTPITYTVMVTDSLGCMAMDSVVINPVICPCDNQVVNGDFESGDTGFTSGLTSSCTCQAGSYCVITDAKLKCNSGLWQNILAPNGTGNYMVIDGSANSDIWTQSVTVVAGYVYEFCFDYYPDISNGSTPPLSVDLDPAGNAWNILPPTTGTAGSWQKICTTWKAPSSGTFDLNISQGAAGNYDDYGIDNIQFGTCCELEVNLPDTITVCENDLVQLNPIVSGAMGTVTYSWSPSTGLSDPSIANPTTTATTLITYTVMVTDSLGCMAMDSVVINPVICPCDNQVVNGDFESGDTGFTSGLTSSCTCQAGSYCVTTDAKLKCNSGLWQNILAPNGTGNYMVIDGSANSDIWTQSVTVIAGYVYEFCFDYYPDISNGSTPPLSVDLDPTGNAWNILPPTTGTAGSWQKICTTWKAPSSGTFDLNISQGVAGNYDDYGIDNIQFGTCCELEVNLPDTITVCENDLVQLNPIVSGAMGAVTYSWSPSTSLSDPSIANPTTTAITTITYTVMVTDSLGCMAMDSVVINIADCPCDDQIVNGDFENGDSGFTSGLTSSCTCQAGSYCVTTDAKLKCNSGLWQNILAPNGTGNYMVIDGSANSDIWTQSVTVVAGYVYDFCFDYYPDISNGSTPPLSVVLDPSGSSWAIIPSTTGTAGSWQKICASWTATSSGTFDLSITQGAAGNYDDYGIDNIQFGTCDSIVSVTDHNFSSSVLVFPNPTYESATIKLGESQDSAVEFQLLDLAGRKLMNGTIASGTTQYELNIEDLADGIYIFFLGNKKSGYYQQKLIKLSK